jgi:hypothetical protein
MVVLAPWPFPLPTLSPGTRNIRENEIPNNRTIFVFVEHGSQKVQRIQNLIIHLEEFPEPLEASTSIEWFKTKLIQNYVYWDELYILFNGTAD